MASSGTTAFNPFISSLTLMAFARLGMAREQVLSEHLTNVDIEANLLQVEMGNKQPLAWTAQLFTQTLMAGTATYPLPANLIAVRDAYLRVTSGGTTTDRVIWPLSTEEYDAQPNKSLRAVPTSFWMNRLITPTVTMWPVPDATGTYALNMRIMTQIQDSVLPGGVNLNMPYRFLDVFVAGLAHRMARIYKPELEQMRKADYMEAWANAAAQDVDDNVSISVMPDFSGFYR